MSRVSAVVIALSAALAAADVNVTVSATNVTTAHVKKTIMGCHSDYGYAQTPRGFTSNMIYGSSFEYGAVRVPAWVHRSAGATANIGISTGTSFSSHHSLGISLPNNAPPTAYGAVVNRGLGGQGLVFEGGKPYTFEAWIWANKNSPAFVELRDFASGASLARVDFTAVGEWADAGVAAVPCVSYWPLKVTSSLQFPAPPCSHWAGLGLHLAPLQLHADAQRLHHVREHPLRVRPHHRLWDERRPRLPVRAVRRRAGAGPDGRRVRQLWVRRAVPRGVGAGRRS